MSHKRAITVLTYILICIPCFSQICVTGDTVLDYLEIASLYSTNNQYDKALEYLKMIEPFDKYNTQILYEKAEILKKLNKITHSEKELNKLVELNKDYTCSDLAKSLDDYNHKHNYCQSSALIDTPAK